MPLTKKGNKILKRKRVPIHPGILAVAKKVVRGEKGQRFDPEGVGYDYKTAIESDGKPNVAGHWGSLDPRTGMVLKGRKHKTWRLMEKEEKRRGSKIVKRGNRYYSVPNLKRLKRRKSK